MKFAAKILAFYFLLGGLMPGSDFGQLGKMEELLQHFRLHRQMAAQQGQTLSFATFVAAHFWQPNNHKHHDGGQSHQELPLKCIHAFSQAFSGHTPFQLACTLPRAGNQFLTESLLLPAGYAGAIFRPPMFSRLA
ncbi:MAG: hypothetical protein H6564_21550 [Lewinellaceae bacterium]|nr:hypothetical protein [Lewinellaceae bacterium]